MIDHDGLDSSVPTVSFLKELREYIERINSTPIFNDPIDQKMYEMGYDIIPSRWEKKELYEPVFVSVQPLKIQFNYIPLFYLDLWEKKCSSLKDASI